jgi:nucleoside-diphosphate-sugar epimerase
VHRVHRRGRAQQPDRRPEANLAISVLGIPHVVSADKARRELGWAPRPFRESVIDTAESLIGRDLIVQR